MTKPVCECCASDEFVVARQGGGYRCERCKTIWDDLHRLVGPQNYKEARGIPFVGFSSYSYAVGSNIKIS